MKDNGKLRPRIMLIVTVIYHAGVITTYVPRGWTLTNITILLLLGVVLAMCARKIEKLGIQYTVDRHKKKLEEENG